MAHPVQVGRRLRWISLLAVLCVPLLIQPLPGHAFDYEDLVGLIRSKNLTTIDQVVAHLPAEYRESYTLVYDSHSLHGSSHDYPRALLFGRTGKLVLTFNGHPDQRKYQHLEMIQFRDEFNEFEMRSIAFENGVEFSGKNPAICLRCHGDSPRPIWSSYEYSDAKGVRHWPGFYGSTHDAPVLNQGEKDVFVRFRELAQQHPRYRFLRFTHPESAWFPFGIGPHKHQFRPNNRLGNLLARLNAKRLAHDLKAKPFFKAHPNLSMLWLLNCPEAKDEIYLEFIENRFVEDYHGLFKVDPDWHESVEQTAFVFEKLLSGLAVYTWNLSLDSAPDEPRFFTGIVSIDELVAAAVLAMMPGDHWLREYYLPWTQRDLYDTFKLGYYAANVAPGGVGEAYDEIGPFYDRARSRQACLKLTRLARQEVAGVDG